MGKDGEQRSRAVNAGLGLLRPPSSFALFCSHMASLAKRRLHQKASIARGKVELLAKWGSMSEEEKGPFAQKAKAAANANAAARRAALQSFGEHEVAMVPPGPASISTMNPLRFNWQSRAIESSQDVQNVLGKGGYGVVRSAKDIHTSEVFAIKLPKNAELAQAMQDLGAELEFCVTLRPPNIISCHSLLLHASEPSGGLLFELASCSLSSWLHSAGNELRCRDEAVRLANGVDMLPEPVRLRYRIALQLSNGLSFMHDKSILHGDLKLQNMLLFVSKDSAIKAKIADLGACVHLGPRKTATCKGDEIYTANYRPVECLAAGHEQAPPAPVCFRLMQFSVSP